MIKKQRYNLVNIIGNDLYINGKLQLLLLLMIMITSILIIVITYQTRLMIMDHEKLLLEVDSLKNEWNNLIIDEKILSDSIRVEAIAIDKLKMHYVNPIVDEIFE